MLSSVQFVNTDLSLSDLEAFFFFSEKKKRKLSSFLRIFSLTLIQPRRMSEISVSSVMWGFFVTIDNAGQVLELCMYLINSQ